MDVREPISEYIRELTRLSPGVKALILDDETASIIGLVVAEHELLQSNIYLIVRLSSLMDDDDPQSTLHSSNANGNKTLENGIEMKTRTTLQDHDSGLKQVTAIVFVRPTAENVSLLRKELQYPKFGEYHLVFSNMVRTSYVEEIADADIDHVVKHVVEYYADYYAQTSQLFTIGVSPCLDAMIGGGGRFRNPYFERVVDGLAAFLLARGIGLPMVRYQGGSKLCRNLAERVQVRMNKDKALIGKGGKFREKQVLLLILDRCEDPVTPLLNQWTYQAMIHELIGLKNNRLNLEKAVGVPPELKEVVMDPDLDEFFKQNCHANFGDLGQSLKRMVDRFEQSASARGKVDSISDMVSFVKDYPLFRKQSLQVSKHVAVTGELSRIVKARSLLEVSQLEQDLACREAESEHRGQVLRMLANKRILLTDKLKLVLLYSLRYEQTPNNAVALMKEKLYQAGHGSDSVNLVTQLRSYAGHDRRTGDVFSNRSFFAKARNTVRRGIGGVDNVYTQHEPLLAYQLHDLFRRKLPSAAFPLMISGGDSLHDESVGSLLGDISGGVVSQGNYVPAVKQIVVFIAGGVTLEEARTIAAINGERQGAFKPSEGSITASAAAAARQIGARVILGGSALHNSASFLQEVVRINSLSN
eukprot:Plantae.Rhodophyta-Hildenbrandia_rubra.ctg24232.p1 GENE.Plantae.Rhodophyta-Hildenbrandia_rubra.ctg24232~~Plantae.Rhodophyta-Hildenbrandia_rubra.ctg24232.p1  ORF type:complete len:643 (+),score=92.22 Plantae.Rhodophyta-Hildenbrandia_rubra.ctg24232:116-2044(+)